MNYTKKNTVEFSVLTEAILKDMPEGVFAEGEGTFPGLYEGPIKWVAKRGIIHDWAIYYHHAYMPFSYVLTNGDKVFSDEMITKLVPCTHDALKLYRK